ncbi:MAG: L,D-transpeptidase [Proteobacteria bacterium]|nr:L,D-transpeptidase [Pseudomonadota bacterium]
MRSGHPLTAMLAAMLWLGLAGTGFTQPLWIQIDLSDQRMQVMEGDALVHEWPVSTARAGKRTPVGDFTPYLLKRRHFSSLYNNAPMPYSIFFKGNYAIHGTDQIDRLGSPASAGCVRLHPDHAAALFEKVLAAGKDMTRVVIRE